MKRIVRQASIFLFLVLLATMASKPYGSYKAPILARLRALGPKSGIMQIDAKDLDATFPASFNAKEVGLVMSINKFPIPAFIDSAVIDFDLIPLLYLRGSASGLIELYHGTIKVMANRSLFGSGLEIAAAGGDIDLGEHPAFKVIGAEGKLGLDFKGNWLSDPLNVANAESGELKLGITNGAMRAGFNPTVFIKIPPVTGVELQLRAQLRKLRLVLSELTLDSSLGTLKGSGAGNLDTAGKIADGQASFNVALTPDGTLPIGQWLALKAHTNVEAPSANWRIDLKVKNNIFTFDIHPS